MLLPWRVISGAHTLTFLPPLHPTSPLYPSKMEGFLADKENKMKQPIDMFKTFNQYMFQTGASFRGLVGHVQGLLAMNLT